MVFLWCAWAVRACWVGGVAGQPVVRGAGATRRSIRYSSQPRQKPKAALRKAAARAKAVATGHRSAPVVTGEGQHREDQAHGLGEAGRAGVLGLGRGGRGADGRRCGTARRTARGADRRAPTTANSTTCAASSATSRGTGEQSAARAPRVVRVADNRTPRGSAAPAGRGGACPGVTAARTCGSPCPWSGDGRRGEGPGRTLGRTSGDRGVPGGGSSRRV